MPLLMKNVPRHGRQSPQIPTDMPCNRKKVQKGEGVTHVMVVLKTLLPLPIQVEGNVLTGHMHLSVITSKFKLQSFFSLNDHLACLNTTQWPTVSV